MCLYCSLLLKSLIQIEFHICFESCKCVYKLSGLYSMHFPIVPVQVESWSGQVNSGLW